MENMITIYICDNELFWIEKAQSLISAHFNGGTEVEISSFREPDDMLKVLLEKQEPADIVILDIDMPGVNGFEAAEKIRQAYPDILLLFYTSHEQYVFESFKFQPFRYIRKAVADTELDLALSAAESVLSKRFQKRITLKTKDAVFAVDVNDIVYYENSGRRCNVHLSGGRVLNAGGTVRELMKQTDSPDFIMVHSGAAVNVRYIESYSGSDLTLTEGTRLPVSRSRMAGVKEAVMRYWRNRL